MANPNSDEVRKASTIREQRAFPLAKTSPPAPRNRDEYVKRLHALLSGNLDFHDRKSAYATHSIHSFPAKFPPQLPRVFIEQLTGPGDVVLDPMAGSGTTIVEALLGQRNSIALDIDPLALRVVRAKTTTVNSEAAFQAWHEMQVHLQQDLKAGEADFERRFAAAFDAETQKFIRYWFAPETIKHLFYLSRRIRAMPDATLRAFFEIIFSSIIITKNGGVSLALDLAHTRPHRAKVVYDASGNLLYRQESKNISAKRLKILTKRLRPVLPEFEQQIHKGLARLQQLGSSAQPPVISAGNARHLPLPTNSVDLIVTSPPYASNAIDYMRAHKFSLVWFGYPVSSLSQRRKTYIGGESRLDDYAKDLPETVNQVLDALKKQDEAKARSVHRYYTEMREVLGEMQRVLRPGKAAVLVVGTSILRGIDIQIAECLAAIGAAQGFTIPHIGIRHLDRNRRMMPAGARLNLSSQIQQRMHQEFVIGFYKPPNAAGKVLNPAKQTIIQGKRLRDISDLPLDLAI